MTQSSQRSSGMRRSLFSSFKSIGALVLMFAILALPNYGVAEDDAPPYHFGGGDGDLAPVSVAKQGFNLEQSSEFRNSFTPEKVLSPTEGFRCKIDNLYYNSHWEDIMTVNAVRRAGPIRELKYKKDDRVGEVRATSPLGDLSVNEWLQSEDSRVQGIVVLHKDKIIFEEYPGMKETDNHIWYSISKTLPGLLVGILEDQGKIDVYQPIGNYLPSTVGTNWENIPVIDILDMASGLDIKETVGTFFDPTHNVHKKRGKIFGNII